MRRARVPAPCAERALRIARTDGLGDRFTVRPFTPTATSGSSCHRHQPGPHIPLELGQRREDAEHEPPGGGGGVDLRALPGEHPQAHAAGRQVLHGVDQVGRGCGRGGQASRPRARHPSGARARSCRVPGGRRGRRTRSRGRRGRRQRPRPAARRAVLCSAPSRAASRAPGYAASRAGRRHRTAPHMRPGFAVQRDRVPVRCSPFVESVGERVHIRHPLTGPHDPDVQVFRHVVILTHAPAHPGPAGGVSKDARIEYSPAEI